MNWNYYTWNAADGRLYDEGGDVDIFGSDGHPVSFASAQAADAYLESNDIRGTVR